MNPEKNKRLDFRLLDPKDRTKACCECGTKLSVKYLVTKVNGETLHVCNKCITRMM